MSIVFFESLSAILVMFLCVIAGFILNKTKLVPDNTATVLSKLETYIFVPALTINTFMQNCTVTSLTSESAIFVYATVSVLIAAIISIPLSKLFSKEKYKQNIFKYALTFANAGFMGNAVVPAILGESELYRYMLFTMPINVLLYTWGVALLIPDDGNKRNILKKLFNPILVSLLIGILCGITGIGAYTPKFVSTALKNLSSCMGPAAMLLSGFTIANYSIKTLLKNKGVFFASILRLMVLPSILVSILYILGADKSVLVLALFATSMPLGLNTVVFPAAYGQDTSTGASMTAISSILAIITIPLMYTAFNIIFI